MRDFSAGLFRVASGIDDDTLLPKNVLASRLRDAERELSRTRYQSVLFSLLAEENRRLRDAADAASLTAGVTARVLARPPQTQYDSLLIDQGEAQGVSLDDVVVFEGIALGRIVSTAQATSVVELFSSPGTEHDVLLGNPVAVSIARGLGGGSFELSVPQEVAVEKGDTIRFPGTESLLAGIVVQVFSEPAGISKTVRFASPISISELDFVRVITRPL